MTPHQKELARSEEIRQAAEELAHAERVSLVLDHVLRGRLTQEGVDKATLDSLHLCRHHVSSEIAELMRKGVAKELKVRRLRMVELLTKESSNAG